MSSTLIQVEDCYAIIIHLDKAVDRKPKVEKLRSLCKRNMVWPARDVETLTDEEKERYKDLKFYHRLPCKYTKDKSIWGHCNYACQYVNVLKYIVENKLDDVIVFEDDAELKNACETAFPYNGEAFIALGGWFYKGSSKGYAGTEAVYYPRWEVVRDVLLKYMTNPKKFRQYDYMLYQRIPKELKIEWSITKLFCQEGFSYIDGFVKNKT